MLTGDDRFEPASFHILALDYFRSAECIVSAQDQDALKLRFSYTVPYFLYTHSLELSFKAFLRARGVSKRELSSIRYRHNLEKLLDGCITHGMHVTEHDAVVVRWLNSFMEDHAFRYLRPGFQFVPGVIDIRQACKAISQTVGKVCKEIRNNVG